MGLKGRLGKVLSFTRTTRNDAPIGDVKADVGGGGFNVTALHGANPGDDSQPLPGDYVAVLPVVGSGQGIAVVYMDPENNPVAGAGEKRIYARDVAGAPVCAVWLKSDGSVVVSNGSGSVELEASGDVTINGATIDTAGNITTSGAVDADEVVVDGKGLADHLHSGVTTGAANTGPNV